MFKVKESISKHSQANLKLYTAHLKHYSSLHRASLDVLLATPGHIPLSPAKEVKENTLPEGRSLLSSNPRTEKRKVPIQRGTR